MTYLVLMYPTVYIGAVNFCGHGSEEGGRDSTGGDGTRRGHQGRTGQVESVWTAHGFGE